MIKRVISAVTSVSILLTSILLPANQALAERRILSEKSLESGKRTPVYDPKMIEGDFRITRADEAAVILDLKSSETTDQIIRFSGNSPIVWARYNPNDARGRIDITRIERTSRDTVRLIIEPFKPSHGKRWSDFSMGYLPIYFHGINPFDNFRGPDDGLWHNINQGAFLAAVGMAQQNSRAHFSFTALASVRQDVQTSTSGGFFRKRVSTTVESWVKPYWLLGLPIDAKSADSFESAYCILDREDGQCPEGYLVQAGVSFIPFNGGNMPMDEYLADVQTQSKSGWTVLAFAVFIALTTWISAGAFAGINPSSFGGWGLTTNPGLYAAEIGAGYVGLSIATRGGSPTTVQDGVFGATDDGVLNSRATGGFGDPTAAITNSFIRPENNDTQGGFLKLYRGSCPDTYSLQQCRDMGYISDEHWGILQRPETWRQYNSTYRMREGLKPQKEVPVGAVDPYELLQNGAGALQ